MIFGHNKKRFTSYLDQKFHTKSELVKKELLHSRHSLMFKKGCSKCTFKQLDNYFKKFDNLSKKGI